jgi:hypothetical protein
MSRIKFIALIVNCQSWNRIGVILSNLIVGILIASRVTGGLSADLYAFDCENDEISSCEYIEMEYTN